MHALLSLSTCPRCGGTLHVHDEEEAEPDIPLAMWFFQQEKKDEAISEAGRQVVAGFEAYLAGRDDGSQVEEEDLP